MPSDIVASFTPIGEKPPFVSLCVICGDEGAKTLDRLLKNTVSSRSSGPMFDEVVIGWNGRDDEILRHALSDLTSAVVDHGLQWPLGSESGSQLDCDVRVPSGREDRTTIIIHLRVHRWKWDGSFAAARQDNFDHARGIWRCYLDTDDVFASSDDPEGLRAIHDSLRAHGVDVSVPGAQVGPPKTLREYIESLRPSVNCLVFPYDYVIGGDGKCLERHPRRRVVRWADGWAWRRVEYYHEDILPIAGCVVDWVGDAGRVVRHYPSESVDSRSSRNRMILQKMLEETEQGKRPAEPRLFFNQATFALQSGDWGRAAHYLGVAIQTTANPADRVYFRKNRARAFIAMAQWNEASQEALALLGEDPDHRDGWDLLLEIAHGQGQWSLVLAHYDQVKHRLPRVDEVDRPIDREVYIKLRVSDALQKFGRWDEALVMAKEALAAMPGDALARDAVKRAQGAVGSLGCLDKALALVGGYLRSGDLFRAGAACYAFPPGSGSDPRVRAARAALRAKKAAVLPGEKEPLPIFRSPSPWARWVGAWILREGHREVALYGSPHPDDVAALRDLVPGVLWHSLSQDARPLSCPGVVVDALHRKENPIWRGDNGGSEDVFVVPTHDVADTARRHSFDVQGLLQWCEAWDLSVRDLRLLASARPDSDPPRLLARTRSNVSSKGRITIYAPHSIEVWSPDSVIQGGCGGSEEAIIYLSREMASRGWDVRVFGPWRPYEDLEIRDGVRWEPVQAFDPREDHGHLVSHRAPWVFQDPILSGQDAWVWHHDHAYPDGSEWSPPVASRTRHLFVSRWQRIQLASQAGVDPKDLRGPVIGNGIPPEEFQDGRELARDPARVVYASQPQRGLRAILEAWPFVLKEEPQAELHVFYGWRTAEFLARQGHAGLWQEIRLIEELMKATPRVIERGRVPQAQLSEEMRRAGVFAYPCVYPEVSCISGLRAAAAGLALVYAGAGALDETMPDKTYRCDPDATTTEEFASLVVKAIRHVRDGKYPREEVVSRVCQESSWAAVADRWEAVLTTTEADDETDG